MHNLALHPTSAHSNEHHFGVPLQASKRSTGGQPVAPQEGRGPIVLGPTWKN